MRRISFVFVLLGLVGCYASEKAGKDIQDTSHDVNQGGIYMHRGALSVYRPEPPQTPELTSAPITKAPAAKPAAAPAATGAAPTAPAAAPPPAATQWPAAPPVTHAPAPSAPSPLPNASDAGVTEPGAFSL